MRPAGAETEDGDASTEGSDAAGGTTGHTEGDNAARTTRADETTGDVPAGRCGYVFSIEGRLRKGRSACCWRETYGDADRCRWHVDTDKSSIISTPLHLTGEALGGLILRGASLAGEEALAGNTFPESDLSDADLRYADLSDTNLASSDLSGADLRHADLSGADLRSADLTDANLFYADLTDADAREASFGGANLESTTLTRTNLRDADVSNLRLYAATLSDTWVNEGTTFDDRCVYERESDIEIEHDGHGVGRHEAAVWTYRALDELCTDNSLPRRARKFHVREKDADRKRAWAEGNYRHALTSEGSRWVMKYGTDAWRVIGISALLVVVAAVLYPLAPLGGLQTPDGRIISYTVESATAEAAETVRYGGPTHLVNVFLTSLYFSAVTFATLGYGGVRPIGPWARALAAIEATLGALLIALLVFVLSQSVKW